MLPNGYKTLQYIETDGTQYIDTGVVPGENTAVITDFQLTAPGAGNECIFGVYGQYSFRWYGANNCFRSVGADKVDFPVDIDKSARHVVKKTPLTCVVDNTYTVSNTPGNTTLSICIFAYHAKSSVSNYAKVRCYNMGIYDGQTMIHGYIPCINPDGDAGLYDVISGTFHGNAGTGAFIAGPEAIPPPPPVEIEDMPVLVTDRTQADVDRLIALNKKAWESMTADEQEEWRYGKISPLSIDGEQSYSANGEALGIRDGVQRGAYNADDLNRVGRALIYLRSRFRQRGYAVGAEMVPKIDWAEGIDPVEAEFAQYLSNVSIIRGMLPLPTDTPDVPQSIYMLSYQGANDIEKILLEVNKKIDKLTLCPPLCGEAVCEEMNL